MKGLIILGDSFEDTEALSSTDVLIRAGEQITRASVMNSLDVLSQCKVHIKADISIDDVKESDYDYLIIPGGKASFTILNKDARVERLIDEFLAKGKLVATICAAPHLLSRKGYFANRQFTCHPGFETYATAGTYRRDLGVYRDDKFVTAKSMYYSIPFGLEIIAFLYGEKRRDEVEKQLMGEGR